MLACRRLVVPALTLPPGPKYGVPERDVLSCQREPTWLMRSEEQRLKSFTNWPAWSSQQPPTLAQAGFYYTGVRDRVRCAFCHGVLKNWRPSDDPMFEHGSHFPSCPFVLGEDCGNIPLEYPRPVSDDVQWKDVDMTKEANRLKSFSSSPLYPGQTPEQLARAGFFYHGDDTKPDRVKCAYCQGRLFDWQPGDEPWLEHARSFPGCPYIRLCLGQDYVDDVQRQTTAIRQEQRNMEVPVTGVREEIQTSTSDVTSVCCSDISPFPVRGMTTENEIDQVMKSSQVEAVVEMGFPKHLVQRIIETRIREKGVGFDTVEDLASLLLENENRVEMESSEGAERDVNVSKPVCSQSEHESGELSERFVCKVCMECNIQVTFLPCGHLVCCGQCALVLEECPICRTAITGMVRTYF